MAGLFAFVQNAYVSNRLTDDDSKPVVLAVKRGILAESRLEYVKAEQCYHEAIKLYDEQDPKDKNEIHKINLYLYLANLYYETKEFKRSFRLFQECLRQLISNHSYENNDEAIIEISLKMSNIFASIDDEHDAKIGYEFCIQSILSRIKTYELKIDPDADNKSINEALLNAKIFMIIILQTYGRYLCSLNEYKHAISSLEQAKVLAEQILVEKDDKIGVIYNDLASAYYGNGDFQNAVNLLKNGMDHLNRAYDKVLGDRHAEPDTQLKQEFDKRLDELIEYKFASISNLCSSLHAQNKHDEAKVNCLKALDIYNMNSKKFEKNMKNEVNEFKIILKAVEKNAKT